MSGVEIACVLGEVGKTAETTDHTEPQRPPRNDSGSVFWPRLVADLREARKMAQHFAG